MILMNPAVQARHLSAASKMAIIVSQKVQHGISVPSIPLYESKRFCWPSPIGLVQAGKSAFTGSYRYHLLWCRVDEGHPG